MTNPTYCFVFKSIQARCVSCWTLAEVMLQSPLDTSRALWEALYVEGLEDGRSALLTKLSHAITDGLGGIALFEQVYDLEREPAPRPMPPSGAARPDRR